MVNFTWRSFYGRPDLDLERHAASGCRRRFVTFGICLLILQFVARFFQALLGLPLEDLNMRAGIGRRMIAGDSVG